MIHLNPRILFFSGLMLIFICFSTLAPAQVSSKSEQVSVQVALDGITKEFKANFIYESSLFIGNKIAVEEIRLLKGKNLELQLSALLEPLSVGYYRLDKNNYALFSLLPERRIMEKYPLKPSVSSGNNHFSISGAVLDGSGKPLEYSSVYLLGNDSVVVAAAIADLDGRFSFRGIGSGKYSLRATRIGYQSVCSPALLLIASRDLQTDLVLEEMPRRLGQILVQAVRPVFEFLADRTILNVQDNFIGSGFYVNDVLEGFPGLMLTGGAYSLKGKQGVAVMIDGGAVNLPSSQLAALLRSIPVSSVSQIELIHSPSAKYDAQAKGGVVNIKLLTNPNRTLSGSVNTGFSMGSQPRLIQSAALNYGWGKVSLFGNYGYQNLNSRSRFFSENIADGQLPVAYQQQQTIRSASVIHNGILAATYQINQKNSISMKGSLVSDKSSSELLRELYLPDSSISSLGKGSSRFNTHTMSFSSSHSLGSARHLLALYADYTSYRSSAPQMYRNTYLGALGKVTRPVESLNSEGDVALNIYSAGLDYTYPFIKGHQLQVGAKLDFTTSDSKVLYQYGNSETLLLTDFSHTNNFRYQEKITSAYLNYHGKIGSSTSLQAGIRAENTTYSSAAISGDQATAQRYMQLFPSFLISYVKGKQVFTFSYHRSLGRPSYQDLNPFFIYFSPFQYAKGNQFLLPETTHSMGLGMNYAQEIDLNLDYSYTVNHLGTISSLDAARVITRENIGNFGDYELLSLSADYQKTLFRHWKLGTNVIIFYDGYRSSYLGIVLKSHLVGFNVNIANSFQIHQNLLLEVLQRFQSKRAELVGMDFGRYGADVALKYGLFNGRANLRLAANDIFYSYLDKGTRAFDKLYSSYSNRNENRRFHVGVSHVFGKNGLRETKMTTGQQEHKRIK